MNNLGIIIPHLGSSQPAYEAIKLANRVQNSVLFFEQLSMPCIDVKCATMCINEIMNFNGVLITTNINNTLMANNIVNRNRSKLIFYVWDLEWLRLGKQDYLYNIQAYNLPDVLVVRSDEHVGPLSNYCNRTPIVKDFQQVLEC